MKAVGFKVLVRTEWATRAPEWRDLGATHLSVNTMGAGLSPRGHIEAILRMKPALDEVR